MTFPSTVALYPPPSGSVSMPPPGDWGEASRRVFGVATLSASFCDAPRRGRAPLPLLFGGMVAKCGQKCREPQHEITRRAGPAPPTATSGRNLVAVYFRVPCRARRRDGDPHRAQVRGTSARRASRAHPGRRPRRARPNPAAAADRGIARALEPADASGMSPARFLLGSPGGLSPSAPRLTDPVSRNARRLSPTARCP